MNESLQLAKLFKFRCSNMDYFVFGLFPRDQDDNTILNFMSESDDRIKEILSSKEVDVTIESQTVSASIYCLGMPEEIYNERTIH